MERGPLARLESELRYLDILVLVSEPMMRLPIGGRGVDRGSRIRPRIRGRCGRSRRLLELDLDRLHRLVGQILDRVPLGFAPADPASLAIGFPNGSVRATQSPASPGQRNHELGGMLVDPDLLMRTVVDPQDP